jgi:hypothetical protein
VGSRVGVVAAREVAVVGGNDRVLLALLDVLSVPLADARTARVGQDDASEVFEDLGLHKSFIIANRLYSSLKN